MQRNFKNEFPLTNLFVPLQREVMRFLSAPAKIQLKNSCKKFHTLFKTEHKGYQLNYSLTTAELKAENASEKKDNPSQNHFVTLSLGDGRQAIFHRTKPTINIVDEKDESRVLHELKHDTYIAQMALLNDDLISILHDNTIKRWDLRTGECKESLLCHSSNNWGVKLTHQTKNRLILTTDYTDVDHKIKKCVYYLVIEEDKMRLMELNGIDNRVFQLVTIKKNYLLLSNDKIYFYDLTSTVPTLIKKFNGQSPRADFLKQDRLAISYQEGTQFKVRIMSLTNELKDETKPYIAMDRITEVVELPNSDLLGISPKLGLTLWNSQLECKGHIPEFTKNTEGVEILSGTRVIQKTNEGEFFVDLEKFTKLDFHIEKSKIRDVKFSELFVCLLPLKNAFITCKAAKHYQRESGECFSLGCDLIVRDLKDGGIKCTKRIYGLPKNLIALPDGSLQFSVERREGYSKVTGMVTYILSCDLAPVAKKTPEESPDKKGSTLGPRQ